MRQKTGDSPGWRTDAVSFSAAGLVLLLGAELAAFTASIAAPQQTAPATDTAPAQNTATPAPVGAASASDGTDRPDPERRLARLREHGGAAKYVRHKWKFTGMAALVESEKADGRKRRSEKTIRADLIQAAQAERDEKTAGFGAGLGQR